MRRVLLTVAAAAAAILFWWVLAGGSTIDPAGPRVPHRDPTTGVAMPAKSSTDRTEAPAPSPQTGLVRTSPETFDPEPKLTVTVVDGRTGQPVPGATVRGLWSLGDRPLTPEARETIARSGWDPETVPIQLGRVVVTDAEGRAAVPRPELNAGARDWTEVPGLHGAMRTLVARKGELYGEATIHEVNATRATIRIAPDRTAHVVVYARGRPAPEVHVLHTVRTLTRELGTTGKNYLATTSDEGTVTVPHLQTRILADEQVSTIAVREPGIELPEATLDCEVPPPAPIRFDLPPFGSMTVEIRDPGGVLTGRSPSVALAEAGSADSFRRQVMDGRAEYAYVGLGKEFEVTVRPLETRTVRGPSRPGEVTEVILEIGRRPILAGRILLPNETPLAGETVGIRATVSGRELRSTVRTGDDGNFRHVLDPRHTGTTLESVRLSTTVLDPELAGMTAVFSGPRVLDGRVDLGELRLVDAPLYAAGRVVDQEGGPIEGAVLRVELPPGEPEVDLPVVRMLDEGRFELRGDLPAGMLLISGSTTMGSGPQPAAVEVTRGDRDVNVVLVRTGSIEATFLHGPGEEYRLDCAMHPQGGGDSVYPFPFPAATNAGTSYRWSSLLPGTWRFTAMLPGESTPSVTIDGIDIRAGKNRDPRLDAIELRDVATLRIEVVDAAGELFDVLEGQVYVEDRGTGQWSGRFFRSARTFVVTRPGPQEVVVVVPGYHPIHRTGVEGELIVLLEPLPTVPVSIVADGPVPDPPRLGVQAEWMDAPGERYRVSWYGDTILDSPCPWLLGPRWIRPGETGRIVVAGPGRYRLKIQVSHGPGRGSELSDFEPRVFEIPADGAPATVEVVVRAADLRR